jgi:hypothetical protein
MEKVDTLLSIFNFFYTIHLKNKISKVYKNIYIIIIKNMTTKEKSTICKSIAKSKYFLTDKDLDDLEYTETRNPRYKRASNMILYDENDIIYQSCLKHGCEPSKLNEKLEQMRIEKETKKEIRDAKKTQMYDKRKLILEEAMALKKLSIRSDSKLCQGFIDGKIKKYTVDEVVERMCQMKYLFDYCDMDTYISKEIVGELEYRGRYDKDDVFSMAEHSALSDNGGKYPKIYPWLKE